MTDELRQRLDALDGEESTSWWNPSVGDELVGVLVDWDVRTARHSGDVPVLTIEDEATGERIEVWLLPTVLRNEMIRIRPELGDRIAIRRLEDGSNGTSLYKRYRVLTEKDRSGPIPWATFDAQVVSEDLEKRDVPSGNASPDQLDLELVGGDPF